VAGPFALYNGALAAASATFVGHYPWYAWKQTQSVVWNVFGDNFETKKTAR
jgi:hypothetical protein